MRRPQSRFHLGRCRIQGRVECSCYDGPIVRVTARFVSTILIVVAVLMVSWVRFGGGIGGLLAQMCLIVLFFFVVLVHCVRALARIRSFAYPGLTLVGWCLGSTSGVSTLRPRGPKGYFGGLGSPVVGVFVDDDGRIALLVDSVTVGLSRSGSTYDASFGCRGRRRWLILESEGEHATFRLFGC